MTAPHELPRPGPANRIAAALANCVPVLDTPRLRLRAPRLTDFAAYAAIMGSPRAEPMGGPFSREHAWNDFNRMVALWLLRGYGLWAVERRADPALVGFVLIGFEPGDAEPELGYMLCDGCDGHGYATEAAAAARAHAFGALGMSTLVSYINPGNDASIAVAERLGARPDGVLAECVVWRHWPEGAA